MGIRKADGEFDTARMIALGQAALGEIPVERLGSLDNGDLAYMKSVKESAAKMDELGGDNPGVFMMPNF